MDLCVFRPLIKFDDQEVSTFDDISILFVSPRLLSSQTAPQPTNDLSW